MSRRCPSSRRLIRHGERDWLCSQLDPALHLVLLGRSTSYLRCVTPLLWLSELIWLVHAFVSHQLQPDEDFDIVVTALKDQAAYWSLASMF